MTSNGFAGGKAEHETGNNENKPRFKALDERPDRENDHGKREPDKPGHDWESP